jgi:hypothetical protein
MPTPVYRALTLLTALVSALPIGTNLGLLVVLWMLLRGELLTSRGAIVPGLSALGLPAAAVRRAWAALAHGAWTSAQLLARWAALVAQEGQWQAHTHGGYHPLAVDVTAIWRPRLQDCPTSHYSAQAGKALPAIPVGVIARVGSVERQRFGLPVGFVRADPADPSPSAHNRALVRQAVALQAPDDALVCDRGFPVALLQEERVPAYVVRVPKNFTARRAQPPAYRGRGRPPTRGALVRPLPRRHGQRLLAATPPDAVTTWHEGPRLVRAEQWTDLVLPDAPPDSPTFAAVAIHDPRYAQPWLLVTPLPLAPRDVRDLYRDRWPVEQLPLVGKQLLGAARQFVHAPESRQRLPELALLAGAVLTYLAATQPAVPTGFWDRHPQRTPGRLRRLLARTPFPQEFPWPGRVRRKAAVTAHLPTGFFGQRGRRAVTPNQDAA